MIAQNVDQWVTFSPSLVETYVPLPRVASETEFAFLYLNNPRVRRRVNRDYKMGKGRWNKVMYCLRKLWNKRVAITLISPGVMHKQLLDQVESLELEARVLKRDNQIMEKQLIELRKDAS